MDLIVKANTADPILLDSYSCGPGIADSDYLGFGQ